GVGFTVLSTACFMAIAPFPASCFAALARALPRVRLAAALRFSGTNSLDQPTLETLPRTLKRALLAGLLAGALLALLGAIWLALGSSVALGTSPAPAHLTRPHTPRFRSTTLLLIG